MSILALEEDKLTKLTQVLCAERKRAVDKRKSQGLDAIWQKARTQYQGLEDESITGRPNLEKGATPDAPMTAFNDSPTGQGSAVFINITRPYTNAGTARVADILLPTNKLPFDLKQTPVSDLETLRGVIKQFPLLAELLPELSPELVEQLSTGGDAAKAALEAAKAIIKDWLKESNWSGTVRGQVIEAGKVGTGVVKGPFPKAKRVSRAIQKLIDDLPSAVPDPNMGILLQSTLKTLLTYVPSIETLKVENCFPDPDCGTDIQNGSFFYERVPEVTKRQLKEFQEDSSYDSEQIQKCLDEGPKDINPKPGKETGKGPFELWVRTGMLECGKGEDKQEFGFQVTTLCNDYVIKSEAFWLETTQFPYHILCWEPRDDSWTGIGIPEEIETPQRGLNSSVRALMDNMGYSVGPQILELADIIEPEDGNWTLHPYKRWKVKSALPGMEAMAEAKNALTFLEFPNYLGAIMPVISFWLKTAEDTTGLSLLLQGQAVTDAVGVSQQLMSNATTNLRLIVKEWDDRTCRPMITAFYEWVQLYGPDEAKGDGVVEPLGSASLIVRELQQQALIQIGDKVLQPIYGISPKKWMQLYLEGFQMDAETLAMSEEELKQLTKAQEEPDTKVVVAQIDAQAEVYKADLRKEVEVLKLSLETEFKQLSLDQSAASDLLNGQIKIIQENMKLEGKAAAAKGQSEGQAPLESQPEAISPDPVDSALETLGM